MTGGARLSAVGKVLAFSSAVEAVTGLVAAFDPTLLAHLLFGSQVRTLPIPFARIAGIALMALAVACWPGRDAHGRLPARHAMLLYNAVVAIYLAYLALSPKLVGQLLWPAIALHAVVTVLLLVAGRERAAAA